MLEEMVVFSGGQPRNELSVATRQAMTKHQQTMQNGDILRAEAARDMERMIFERKREEKFWSSERRGGREAVLLYKILGASPPLKTMHF